MEEDIKILEEFLDLARTRDYKGNLTGSFLENLITRYKQLEEENKSKQKAYDDCYCEYKHYKQFDSIPKSKVTLVKVDDENNSKKNIDCLF